MQRMYLSRISASVKYLTSVESTLGAIRRGWSWWNWLWLAVVFDGVSDLAARFEFGRGWACRAVVLFIMILLGFVIAGYSSLGTSLGAISRPIECTLCKSFEFINVLSSASTPQISPFPNWSFRSCVRSET